jgi:ABC-type branched-subunit amino acid transport system ATPase component/ABC-type branched-subunit amino acid transport system permease subunit
MSFHAPVPTRRQLTVGLAWVVGIVGLKLITASLDAHGLIQAATPLPTVLLGVILGLPYGLLSVGLILIYRTNKIINFAHGQIGAFGSAFFGLAAVTWHVPYWIALPMALVVGAGVGSLAETAVVRRLRKAPRLMSVVATLGVGQFLVTFASVINGQASAGSLFPEPPGMPVFDVGALHVTKAYSSMLLLSPVAVLLIAVFLRASKYGLAMQAAAANPDAARMAGISAARMSGLAWAIAGALSAFSAVLTQPAQGFSSGDSFGPSLLLLAMAGAAIARMNNLPQALLAGVGLGVVQELLLWNYPKSGLVEVALFVIILVALLLQKQRGGREEEKGSWATVQALTPVPESLRRIWLVRHLGHVTALAAFAVAATVPLWMSNAQSTSATTILAFSMIGLSIGVLTGLGGQLTLGQFAVGAMGAIVSFYTASHTGWYPLALLYAGLVAGCVSVLVGLPALRIRGLMLTVTTLAFALATPTFLVSRLLGCGSRGVCQDPGKPILPGGHALDTGKEYYWYALVVFLGVFVVVRNIRSSGFGRLLVAVRDNEEAARAFTVRASMVKVQGYLLSGFIAGVGGAVYAHSLGGFGPRTFAVKASLDVVVMTVIGGVSLLAGPVLGALLVIGVPAFAPVSSLALAATQLGQLILILYLPGGLAQIVRVVRDRTIRLIAQARGIDYDAACAAVEADSAGQTASPLTPALSASPVAVRSHVRHHSGVLLEARELRKRFGGVVAVDGVSFQVHAGETLGLIGPNGAGKTTTFELLSGFTSLDSGRVLFNGSDVTRLGPETRGQRGLIRSFQDAALFPTMTVSECVELALERVQPTSLTASVAGWTAGERRKHERARELVAFMGLEAYRDKQVRELSTGTRRITEIACLVALQPTLLLLDEPSSGIAQRESEALGQLLRDLKRTLDLTLVVIEHDIPLIMSISDRIVAMADGKVICAGAPEDVKVDPLVVEAYLGGNIDAIERSGARAGGSARVRA